jgi:hypothetical protein
MELQMSNSEKLRNMLISLCSTDEDNKILDKLCEAVVKIEDGTVQFEDSEFEYRNNEQIVPAADLPESFKEIAKIATTILWDGGGPEVGFELFENGESGAEDWVSDELDDDEKKRIEASGPLKCSFCAGQHGLYFDPTRKLANGEPALSFISHESCKWVEVSSMDQYNYKQIFLRLLSDEMVETDFIREIYF